jgi:hypothetical protein
MDVKKGRIMIKTTKCIHVLWQYVYIYILLAELNLRHRYWQWKTFIYICAYLYISTYDIYTYLTMDYYIAYIYIYILQNSVLQDTGREGTLDRFSREWGMKNLICE